jgi:lipoprotein signal peptidase
MKSAALVLATTAILLSLVDLAHKASAEGAYLHSRSTSYVAVVLALTTVWAVAILATRSLSIAVGGGVLAGGALGNLASLALWPGVPNPVELGPIAFNLADVFVLAGFVLTAGAALIFATRNRDRLYDPVRLT